jgi:hypothetical protein
MRDKDDFTELWKTLPKDLKDELIKAAEESSAASPEDFVNEIFVGDCPNCGSRDTRDCEEEREVEDITVGLCNSCGHLWCTECGRPVVRGSTCEHWGICEQCAENKDEFGDCGIPTWECERVSIYEESEDEETVLTCAWCNKAIEKDAEVFALGAKARKGMNLKRHEGSTIRIPLRHTNRAIPGTVPGRSSEAKKEGNDILFMICSKKCGELLKKALLKERLRVV